VPGLFDYSLLVGLAPQGTHGGLASLEVQVERNIADAAPHFSLHAEHEEQIAILGIVDVLQPWTAKKKLAQVYKRAIGMETDNGTRRLSLILDTAHPASYRERFLAFMEELFTQGSWLESLPRLSGGTWAHALHCLVDQLPEPQRSWAHRQQALAESWAGTGPEEDEHENAVALETLSSFLAGVPLTPHADSPRPRPV